MNFVSFADKHNFSIRSTSRSLKLSTCISALSIQAETEKKISGASWEHPHRTHVKVDLIPQQDGLYEDTLAGNTLPNGDRRSHGAANKEYSSYKTGR